MNKQTTLTKIALKLALTLIVSAATGVRADEGAQIRVRVDQAEDSGASTLQGIRFEELDRTADVVLPVELNAPLNAPLSRAGRIGVGTWKTQAEFKDIRVEKDGTVLWQSDFTTDMKGWKEIAGQWEVVEGALRQTSNEQGARILVGDPQWTDYTLSLKARKLSGTEGFLILFQVQDEGDKAWWNLGGWDNNAHGLETPGVDLKFVPGKIEPARWYDIRVELKGGQIRCYLDGELVQEATRVVTAVAGRKQDTGEIILKVVNGGSATIDAEVMLPGAKTLQPTGKVWVLSPCSPAAENSVDEPAKMVITETPITGIASNFRHSFPPYSVTVLQIQEEGK